MLALVSIILLLCCVFSIPAVVVVWLSSALHDFFDRNDSINRALQAVRKQQ